MIKIIKGTFGFWDGTKVVPKTSNDKPFSIEPKREAELVKAGIAEYTEKTAETDEPEKEVEYEETEEFEVNPENLEKMNLPDLKDLAYRIQMEYKQNIKKADLIEALLAHLDKRAEEDGAIGEELEIDAEEAIL